VWQRIIDTLYYEEGVHDVIYYNTHLVFWDVHEYICYDYLSVTRNFSVHRSARTSSIRVVQWTRRIRLEESISFRELKEIVLVQVPDAAKTLYILDFGLLKLTCLRQLRIHARGLTHGWRLASSIGVLACKHRWRKRDAPSTLRGVNSVVDGAVGIAPDVAVAKRFDFIFFSSHYEWNNEDETHALRFCSCDILHWQKSRIRWSAAYSWICCCRWHNIRSCR